jgi:hypothetical protein
MGKSLSARNITIFDQYAQLATLRSKARDKGVQRDAKEMAPGLEKFSALARQAVPNVRLSDVSPRTRTGSSRAGKLPGAVRGHITVEEVCNMQLVQPDVTRISTNWQPSAGEFYICAGSARRFIATGQERSHRP